MTRQRTRTTRTLWSAALAAALALGFLQVPGSEPRDSPAYFMRRKLEHALAIFEGLIVGDAETVAVHANRLNLSGLDEGGSVIQTLEYANQRSDFERLTDELSRAAREEDLDLAAQLYVQMAERCFQCHKLVRDAAPVPR